MTFDTANGALDVAFASTRLNDISGFAEASSLGKIVAQLAGGSVASVEIEARLPEILNDPAQREARCAVRTAGQGTGAVTLRAKVNTLSPELHQIILTAQGIQGGAEKRKPASPADTSVALGDTSVAAKYDRLWEAIDGYPYPFALYDKDMLLVLSNRAYNASMAAEPSRIVPGMALAEVTRIALDSKHLVPLASDASTSIQEYLEKADNKQPFLDLEFEGDIHHRVFRSVTPLGDMLIARLDSTALVRERRAAETSHNRLLSALNAYPFPFAIYDDQDCIVVWNDAYRRSMSKCDDFIEAGMHRTVIAEHAIRAGLFTDAIGKEDLWSSIEHQNEAVRQPIEDLRLEGDIHHRLYRTRAPNGDLVILRTDITELIRKKREVEDYALRLEEANKQILQQNNQDQLTGLANRRSLLAALQSFQDMPKDESISHFALAIDLDHFKFINDSLGHAAGDEVLMSVSRVLLDEVAPQDVVARVGGDEYIILGVQQRDEKRDVALGDRLLTRFDEPVQLEAGSCRVGVSIGVAAEPLSRMEDLLLHADVALYRAKADGRGRIGHFHKSDLERIQQKRAIEVDLERALARREFEPYYQPQIDARSGKLTGLEVLARWNHPRLGTVRPSYFLGHAEELGLLDQIDDQVFERALTDSERWLDQTDSAPRLAFNVSADRLQTKTDILIAGGRGYPGGVSFELLETVFVEEQNDQFFRCLQRAGNAGIDIEVDDFGSGRTSILALLKLSPQAIKIDRRIVKRLGIERNARQVLQSIIQIGRVMNARLVAEGVETECQARDLRELGFDVLQGFYFGEPMNIGQLMTVLREGGWPEA